MRNLGVTVDSRLNFSDHVEFIVKRGDRALGLLKGSEAIIVRVESSRHIMLTSVPFLNTGA